MITECDDGYAYAYGYGLIRTREALVKTRKIRKRKSCKVLRLPLVMLSLSLLHRRRLEKPSHDPNRNSERFNKKCPQTQTHHARPHKVPDGRRGLRQQHIQGPQGPAPVEGVGEVRLGGGGGVGGQVKGQAGDGQDWGGEGGGKGLDVGGRIRCVMGEGLDVGGRNICVMGKGLERWCGRLRGLGGEEKK